MKTTPSRAGKGEMHIPIVVALTKQLDILISPPDPYPKGVLPPSRFPETTAKLLVPLFPTPYCSGPQAPGPFMVA
ncbi:hypothetical protein [Janthinobacterium sp. CAN_S7]|uniref:hypothetical protein n=1 Tax=Janthinobacterium sp. CAN_S7 TaxID=3071704 RepID=UPI00319DAAD0